MFEFTYWFDFKIQEYQNLLGTISALVEVAL